MSPEFSQLCAARWALLTAIAFSPRGYDPGGHTGGHAMYVARDVEGWTLQRSLGWCRLTSEEVAALKLPETPVGESWSAPLDPPCGLPQGVLIQSRPVERVAPDAAEPGERLTGPGEGQVVSNVCHYWDLSASVCDVPGPPVRDVWRFRYA